MDLRKIYYSKSGIEWTVTRLVTFILVIIIIALLIFGPSQAVSSLKQKVVNYYYSVKNYFSSGDGKLQGTEVSVPGVCSGEFFISEDECKIDMKKYPNGSACNLGSYRLNFSDNQLQRYIQIITITQKAATPLYFIYDDKEGWKWSPDTQNWMKASERVVRGGSWDGQSPVETNLILLGNLAGKNYEEGMKVFPTELKKIEYMWYKVPDSLIAPTNYIEAEEINAINRKILNYLKEKCQ
jgi:hypothetical protein